MKYSELVSLIVYTDGGASNNGDANGSGVITCYGSYLVVATTKDGKFVPVKHEDRLPMPHLETNNEAEYQALVYGLKYIDDLFIRIEKQVPVQFKMDSDLVFKQLAGIDKCKAKNLKHLFDEAKELVQAVNADLHRISGNEIKTILGH